MPYDPQQLDADVNHVMSLPDWQDSGQRPRFIRDMAVQVRGDLAPDEHAQFIGALWQRADDRGMMKKAADFTGKAVEEVVKSGPAAGAAAGFAALDAINVTDTGSGTRMERGVANLVDATGQRLKQLAPGQSKQAVRDSALDDLRTDLDAGSVPAGFEAWLAGQYDGGDAKPDAETQQFIDALSGGYGKLAVQADHMGKVKPEKLRAWMESDRNPFRADSDVPGQPGPRELLADYMATRDPSSWDAFKSRVTETDAQYKTRLQRWTAEQSQTSATMKDMPEGLMKEMTGRAFDMQTSPIDMATAALPFLRGAKALQAARAGGIGAAAGRVIKGAAKEGAQEGTTEALQDPRATAGQITEAAAMGAVGSGVLEGGMAATGAAFGQLQRPSMPETQPPAPSPTVSPSPSPQQSTLARIAAESVAPEGDTGALTAEDVANLEAEGSAGTPARMARPLPQPILQGLGQPMSDPTQLPLTPAERAPADKTVPDAIEGVIAEPQTITGSNVQMGTEMPVPPPTAQAGAGAGMVQRTPEQMAESAAAEQARLAQVARLRMIDNKAQGMPMIADSPSGSLDILDFANENPIFLPPGFSEQRNLPEYEKLKESKLPPYWRQFIASNKRGGNPSTVAQRAFDAGFIAEPTADAYINALREGIDGRQQYRAQFATREKALAAEEKQVVAFDKSQTKLAKKPDTQTVPFEDVLPGDQMTIDGEQAVVKNVEFNEDGYLTNVVIEDGKRFGLMNFDPQTRGGILVDEYQPKAARTQAAASDFAPESPSPSLPSQSLESLLQGTESTRPKNKGETTRDQNADPLGELMGAKLAGEAEQAQGKMALDASAQSSADKQREKAFTEAKNEGQAELKRLLNAGRGTLPNRNSGGQWIITPSSKPDVIVQVTSIGPDGVPIQDLNVTTQEGFNDLLQNPDLLEAATLKVRPDVAQARKANLRTPGARRGYEYNYKLKLREVGPGTAPDGWVKSSAREVSYDRPLTSAEISNFEMQPVGATEIKPLKNLNVNGTTAGFANAQILSEAADLIRSGFTTFANWSQAMLTRFGRGIQDYLAGIWQQVKDGAGDALMSYLEKTGAVKNFQATAGKAIPRAATPNETQARFASPNAADRVINGPRTDEIVAADAQDWLASLDTAAAVEAFASQQVPLPLDAAEHAAGVLISRLSDQATSGKTEVQRMWAHNAGLRMARNWTKEFLSADPARALRQRGVVNNTILAPIAPILAAQELLVDRADAIMDKRFEGGAAGATEKVNAIVTKADTQAGETLADQLEGEVEEAPELGDNEDLQTGPDPRIADLEARLKAMREQMAAGDAAMQETTGTWQKILELLNAASKRKSALLTGARSRMALARKAAQNRKAQRRAEGRLSANPVEDFADDAIIGTSFLAEGIVEFFNWGQAMIREVGARSNTELKQLYAAASKNYLDALKAEQAKPQKPTGKRTPAREKINKAQRTAQSILDALSRRYSDPPIFDEGQRKVNAMRELYKEHVKNPMPEATFVSRAQALGANVGTAGMLWEAATLEIEAREIMTREAMRAKLNPLLSQNSPALAKLLNTLRAKMFPGMKWADIFMDLPASQKARQIEIYKRLMKDKRMVALAPHERLALTNELDKAWQRERRKVFMRELEKAGVLGEKKAKDREKVKAAAPRLLRLMNLGMLNSEMFREALAKEYGLKMIDAATAAELRAIGERIQKAPEGLPRRKLEQQLMERLQSLAGSTLWQVMDSWWTASVLSGWRTQVDIGLSIASGIEDVGLGSIVTALRTGNKDVALRGLGNLFARIPSAFMESVDHVATGNKAMMRNFELEAKQAMEGGNRMASDVGAQMWRDGGWRKVPGGFMVFYGRMMTALDHINSASTREGAKAMALARHPELYQKALRISEADKQAARQQARLEMTGGAMPTTQQERLEETARMREILEQGIPTEVIAQATEIGRAAALQGEPTGLGGLILNGVVAAVNTVNQKAQELATRENPDAISIQGAKVSAAMVPLARAITGTKFARTVAHSINRTTSYVPVVGLYTVGQKARTGAFGDILAAKQVIGTLVGIALYLAFDDDDDEKGIEDGWKDKTLQEKAQLYAQGKQPFSVWQRDDKGRVRSFNYQQWGVAGIMNTVAAMLKQKGSEAGTMNVLMSSLVQGGMSFTDKAQLQGLQTVIGEKSRSTDPASGLAANLNKWAAQTVGGMVPRLLKDIDMVASPELRSSSEWWQKWAKEVPMLRQLSSGKRIDILGGDILLDRGPLSRVTNLGTADPAYRMLGRLNEKDIWLPDPTQGVRVVKLNDGTRRPMTPQEKDRYQRLTGAAYRTFLGDYGPQLLQMEPTKAQDTLSDITKHLRDRAAYQATH